MPDPSSSPAPAWPALSYADFAPTQHLLHMMLQVVGKLKLADPFHAEWAEVPLWITATGLGTGPIPCETGAYEIRLDLIAHRLDWVTSQGAQGGFDLGPGSVADFADTLLGQLRGAGVEARIDMMPQEVPNPVPFDQDKEARPYQADLVTAWWRVMLRCHRVLYAFQGRFTGKTQPIGLMWGTLDIRLALYNGKPATPGKSDGFIRSNAMNAELMEMGWWSGDPSYQKPAFYAFTYPQPKGIEQEQIGPDGAGWSTDMGEFVLDYDKLRQADDPDAALMRFLTTSYQAGASTAGWSADLLGGGKPI